MALAVILQLDSIRQSVFLAFYLLSQRYQECLERVKQSVEARADAKLNEAEQFLLTLGKPHLRLLESLSLWKFKGDCEAMEREICNPLRYLLVRFPSSQEGRGT